MITALLTLSLALWAVQVAYLGMMGLFGSRRKMNHASSRRATILKRAEGRRIQRHPHL
jgi:hypothetical protein